MEPDLIWAALLTTLAGAAVTWVCAPRIIDMLLQTVGPRANYRRRPTSFPAGLALILGAVGGQVVSAIVTPKAWHEPVWAQNAACLVLTLGFGLSGLTDDLLGGHDHSGFRGHLGAMRRGVVTTGVFKIASGAIISLAAVAVMRAATWAEAARVNPWLLAQFALDSALIATSANLINLLDRRPGRAIKGFLLGILGAMVWIVPSRGAHRALWALTQCAGAIGAAIAMLPLDLGEQAMLGDTGSNPLGAVLGLLLLHMSPGTRIVLLALAVWLTLTSERVSFGEAIDSNRVLRFLDRLGRRDP